MAFLTSPSSFSSPSSSSSSFNPGWTYDVFLSFRGEDTRNNFTGHLYHALHQKGVNIFIDDDKLQRGEEISAALLGAIEESRVSIVVLSQNYASSTWCLDELLKILECKKLKKQMVRPIFYKVDPSEVRKQMGQFGKAFKDKFKDNTEKMQRWRAALEEVANLSGWHLGDGHESKFIQRIVEEVLSKLNRSILNVAKNPVGVDSHVRNINSLLNIRSNAVFMVGIYGMGGIGKTTIAKAVYNMIADEFEGSSFLVNVRETSKSQAGLVQLQETLLCEILGDKELKVGNVDRGINVIRDRLRRKRVLIVLDDVDHFDQLNKLAADSNWFGSGTRIIITTRDKHIFDSHGVKTFYKVVGLSDDDALQLFNWNAFRNPYSATNYEELSSHVVDYAKGLPLAVIVLGSYLCGRSIRHWKSALNQLKRSPNKQIYDVLKISFDGLADHEKDIFLDIACFFKGENKDYVTNVLESCELDPDGGIEVLISKSLITVEYNKLWMHDLLQEMGREIVRQESPKVPGKRSRLWFHEDIVYVLEENVGTSKIEGIKLDLAKPEKVHLSAKAFRKMTSLRLLIVRNANIDEGPEYLPNKLRWLEWSGYPLPSLPSDFCPKKLVGLNLCNSRIKEIGNGFKSFENLKFMNFSCCEYLTEIPNCSSIPNLESLICDHCTSLVHVHQSVGFLNKLVILDLRYCSKLESLPSDLNSKYLETLFLTGCSRVEKFPNILVEMERLERIYLEETAIRELPSTIERVIRLKVLHLQFCKNLTDLPSGIYQLQDLVDLDLNGCSKLRKFPENIRAIRHLTSSMLNSHNFEISPSLGVFPLPFSAERPYSNSSLDDCPFFVFRTIDKLTLRNCNLLEVDFLRTPCCFSTLTQLDLSGNNFISLPECVSRLNNLRSLNLENCKQLREIPELPRKLWHMGAHGCRSLERCSQVSSISRTTKLPMRYRVPVCRLNVDFSNCHKLAEKQGNNVVNILLSEGFEDSLYGITFPGSEIPEWFIHQSTKGSIFVRVPVDFCEEFVGFAAVFGSEDGVIANFSCKVQVFHADRETYSFVRDFHSLESDHVWLEYHSSIGQQSNIWPRQFMQNLRWFKVSFTIIDKSPIKTILKRCGVFVLCENREVFPYSYERSAFVRSRSEIGFDFFVPLQQGPKKRLKIQKIRKVSSATEEVGFGEMDEGGDFFEGIDFGVVD